MALTLDGTTVLPSFGMGGGSGVASGVGAGAIGGGLLGLLAGGLLAGRGGWGNGFGGYGGAAPVATAAATDILLNPAFQSLQNQIDGVGGQIQASSISRSFDQTQGLVSSEAGDLQSSIANLATAQASNNFTTLNSINGLGRDLTASATQALINNIQNFNQLQQANTLATSQIITQGTANAAQMANCCCEIKGLILADGNATRALINDLNVQSLRDQLSSANNKVSNNEQNQYLLGTILAHLKPTVGTVIV